MEGQEKMIQDSKYLEGDRNGRWMSNPYRMAGFAFNSTGVSSQKKKW
jgi:hypothetical protein